MIRPYSLDQLVLIPQDVREFLDSDHEAVVIQEVMQELENSETVKFRSGWSTTGRPAYNPIMLMSLLCYAYAIGIRSSRKISKLPVRDMGAYWLTAGEKPDFRTICLFRKSNRRALELVFSKVLTIAEQLGMLRVGTISLDGSKIKAHATNSLSRPDQLESRRQELERLIHDLLREADVVDFSEDQLMDDDLDETEWSKEYRNIDSRKKRLNEAAKALRHAGKRSQAKKLECAEHSLKRIDEAKKIAQFQHSGKSSVTDPDSRLVKAEYGSIVPGYNAQLAVEEQSQIIIGATVIQDATDTNAAPGILEDIEKHLGSESLRGREILADNGYFAASNLREFEKKSLIAIVRPEGEGNRKYFVSEPLLTRKKRFGLGEFIFNSASTPKESTYTCPNGRTLNYRGTEWLSSASKSRQALSLPRRKGWHYKSNDCSNCTMSTQCLLPKTKVRSLLRDPEVEPIKERTRERFRTAEGREKYKKRMYTVEPVFADIKEHRGMRRFLLRGINGVKTEWKWACLTHNLLKVGNKLLQTNPPLANTTAIEAKQNN